MPEIVEYVRLNIPETFDALKNEGGSPDSGDWRHDVAGPLIATTLSRLGMTEAGIDGLGDKSEFVKSYVADLVTRMMIPTGIDFWQSKGRLNETTSLPAGFVPGGGETTTYYDKVEGLQTIDGLLAARIAANTSAFAEAAGGTSDQPSAAFGVSSTKEEQLAQDPFTAWDRIDADRLVSAGITSLVVIRE